MFKYIFCTINMNYYFKKWNHNLIKVVKTVSKNPPKKTKLKSPFNIYIYIYIYIYKIK